MVIAIMVAGGMAWYKYNRVTQVQSNWQQQQIRNGQLGTMELNGCNKYSPSEDRKDPNLLVTDVGDIYYCNKYRGNASSGLVTLLLSTTTQVTLRGDASHIRFDYAHESIPEFQPFAPKVYFDNLLIAEVPTAWAGQLSSSSPYSCSTSFVTRDIQERCGKTGSYVSAYQLTDYRPVTYNIGGLKEYYWQRIYVLRSGSRPVIAVGSLTDEPEFDSVTLSKASAYETQQVTQSGRPDLWAIKASEGEDAEKVIRAAKSEARLAALVNSTIESQRIDSWNALVSSATLSNPK